MTLKSSCLCFVIYSNVERQLAPVPDDMQRADGMPPRLPGEKPRVIGILTYPG